MPLMSALSPCRRSTERGDICSKCISGFADSARHPKDSVFFCLAMLSISISIMNFSSLPTAFINVHFRAIQQRVQPLFASYGMETIVEIVDEVSWLLLACP